MTSVKAIASRAVRALVALALCASMLVSAPGCGSAASGQLTGAAAVAASEYAVYAGDDGEKYWSWMGFAQRVAWCACFASYCADQAGLIEAGCAPRNAGVLGWISFYERNPDAGTLYSGDSGYVPSSGDFIIWQRSLDPDARYESHIGIVEYYDAATDTVHTIEGNLSRSMMRMSYPAGTGITYYAHPAAAGATSGLYGCSQLAGDVVTLPEGLGDVHTYMGWQLITDRTSAQYKLREEAGETYDAEGFAKIGSRYVVACTTTYGDVGDYVNVTQANGTVIECIIGDIKSQSDAGCNKWGHQDGNCVIEFVVDCATWYDASWSNGTHVNPGTASFHPEWDCDIVSVTNLGSFFDGASPGTAGAAFGLYGCSSISAAALTTDMGGLEGDIARELLSHGLGYEQAAAMLAVIEFERGFSQSSWTDVEGQVSALMSEYGSWAASERSRFEAASSAGQAAELLGRYFAGLPEAATDWNGLRESAQTWLSAMKEGR